MSRRRTVLVLGGARAGKSAYAEARAEGLDGRVAFVATAEPLDAEMSLRIARHRADRPPHWQTIEAPRVLSAALEGLAGKADVVVVDCLTVWVANVLGGEAAAADDALRGELALVTGLIGRRLFDLVLVSNEVGSGVHPETALGRRFRDALGWVNQAVARAADEVVLVVAGCPVSVKEPP